MRSEAALGRSLALLACALAWACAAAPNGTAESPDTSDASVVRYRLRLSENPVDSSAAYHCYTACQPQETPEGYLECLSECPGFERTPGVACLPNEVPPVAACFTARTQPVGSEPQPGVIVIGVVADVPLVVGLASVCAAQESPCSYSQGGFPP